jgi:hypothetical protein
MAAVGVDAAACDDTDAESARAGADAHPAISAAHRIITAPSCRHFAII